MKIKNYGFIIKAPEYTGEKTVIPSKSFQSIIITVSSMEEAYIAADTLLVEGVDVIELCG